MRQLTITHVLTRFLTGGSERRVQDFVAAFPSHVHHLIVGREVDLDRVERLLPDVSVTVVPSLVRPVSPLADATALRRVVALLRSQRPDLVHTCQSKAGVVGRLAARLVRVPLVLHSLVMANFGTDDGARERIYRIAERAARPWTDAYLVAGADLRQRYVSAGIAPAGACHVVRASLPVDRLRACAALGRDEARRAFDLPGEGALLAYVGSLEPRKRVTHLPALLQAVRADVPDARLLIAGDGPERDAVVGLARTAGLADAISLLGYTPDVPELLAASDCVVLLSKAEGLPQVLVQAAAVGTPFVAYAVDGVDELVRAGADGVAVAQGDVAGAAAALVGRLRTGRRAQGFDLTEWSAETVHERYRELVSELLER